MGGKNKNTNRSKNNMQPSSSSRSAELFNASVPSFVSFSDHCNWDVIPMAPGAGPTMVKMEHLDVVPNAEFQLVLRKLSKKDPLTKKKALLELITLLNTSELDTVKAFLRCWPKFYQNLSSDLENSVRELAQSVMQILVNKCKRAIAPYLKQIVPTWLASRFDSYLPAAAIAETSFKETFMSSGDRTQEVCRHCQKEILEYTTYNLISHTPDTLSKGKNISVEEANQKYQRAVVTSLKTLSFLIAHTANAHDLSQLHSSIKNLLAHKAFWRFAQNQLRDIRAAWFELIYQLLKTHEDIISDNKSQIIHICFENIGSSDSLVAAHVWTSILVLQSTYDDWYKTINFKNSVLPKLSALIRNDFNGIAETICPNLLPFVSKLSPVSLKDMDLKDFYKQFFDDIKEVITAQKFVNKTTCAIIIKTYFECFCFVLHKMNKSQMCTSDEQMFIVTLFKENFMDVITVNLTTESSACRSVLLHASVLITFIAAALQSSDQSERSCLYNQLFKTFWENMFHFITENTQNKDVNKFLMDNIIVLVYYLYYATPNFEEIEIVMEEIDSQLDNKSDYLKEQTKQIHKNKINLVHNELQSLMEHFLSICLNNIIISKSSIYIIYVRRVTKLFSNIDLYTSLTPERNLYATLDLFMKFIDILEENEHKVVVDEIFEILHYLEKSEQIAYIESNLLKISQPQLQIWILQRLLSDSFCKKGDICDILSKPNVGQMFVNIAQSFVCDNSNEKINLLRKFFVQMESGAIDLNPSTIDDILTVLSQALNTNELNDKTEKCGNLIAEIMPIVSKSGRCSKTKERDMFLQLFKLSVEHTGDTYITEETICKVTTAWQNALAHRDIKVDIALLQDCLIVVEKHIQDDNRTPIQVCAISNAIAHIFNFLAKDDRVGQIDEALTALFRFNTFMDTDVNILDDFCLYTEALKGLITPCTEILTISTVGIKINCIYRRSLLNLCTILNLNNIQFDDSNSDVPNENLTQELHELIISEILHCIKISAIGNSFIHQNIMIDNITISFITELSKKIEMLLMGSSPIVQLVQKSILDRVSDEANKMSCRSILFLKYCEKYFSEEVTVLLDDLTEYFLKRNVLAPLVNTLQYISTNFALDAFTIKSDILYMKPKALSTQAAIYRCLLYNKINFKDDAHSAGHVVAKALDLVSEVTEMHHNNKVLLLYNEEIHKCCFTDVINTTEYIKLLVELITFSKHLTRKNWDSIRVGLSAWTLSTSKSIENYSNPKVGIFVVNVYKLFSAVRTFMATEKQKSSTELLSNVLDEWENLFAREINLVLFTSFYRFCNNQDYSENYAAILEEIIPSVEQIDYEIVYSFAKSSNKITLDQMCDFLLQNVSNPIHSMRSCCVHILNQLTKFFIADDIIALEKKSETYEGEKLQLTKWHFLHRFDNYITSYASPIQKYINEFSFKLTEIANFQHIQRNECLPYLMLWNCILDACTNTPVSLRSVYTRWLCENKYEEIFLHFLFRAMPVEILKNYDSKIMNNDIFQGFIFTWYQFKDRNVSLEKCVCQFYTEVVRQLPAVVRKWWNRCPSRQKTFVDRLTTNFVSPLICADELKAIYNKREKHENMQITVHSSSREVLAVYSVDEARMELIITLAQNYPLGTIKVECGKQIGGRLLSRNVGMQLTIFLMHQNGNIFDGLTMWKNNLDKKFEGVEECYVCYTVIHQDTCQLPKLSCKTCKKKFHAPCLYKWFTTSSKSTCPICRNVF